ncbi:hybrid sensor histidine kinase/response regulator transcription factor [uncultured Chitinophaga sp.]|uniref:hybrid sensor histidine kinase/response regulator transcription factor n=1 Tax=uncultured Chitinophaga sp. TaxID=339340 RepID=UPI0025CB7BE2|nr:hybrid sensor histidine kinase/response regulator transcription factor [uncultured Chitinophaga sp.]
MKPVWSVLLFFISGLALPARADIRPPVSYIGLEQGLSNNSVRCIYKDHKGYMWFGTYDGLNQYNGYEFKVFRNKLNDPASLPHNYIYAITGDHHNNLFVGTGQGLVQYNGFTGRFSPVDFKGVDKEYYRLTGHVNALKTDKPGNVFICTNGLGLMVKLSGERVALQAQLPQGRNYTSVQVITIDEKGGVWMVIGDVGLCKYDYQTNSVSFADSTIKAAHCMEADGQGNLWVGTGSGLYKFDLSKRRFTLVKTSCSNITTMHVAADKKIWIGTEGDGLMVMNGATGQTESLKQGRNGLSSESVSAIYGDSEQRVWIGTIKGGINVIDPQKSQFQTISRDPFDKNSLVYNFVSCFYENGDELYVGTDGGGFSIWDRKKDVYRNYTADAGNPASLSSNIVTSILKDASQTTWVATFPGGVNKFDAATGRFQHYKCINPKTNTENKNVWLLFEDRDKDLWAATFGAGKLYRFNRSANQFEMFEEEFNDLISMAQDKDGMIWAGNFRYLVKIDKHRRKYEYFDIGKPVRAISADKNGGLWLGTEGGGLVFFKDGKIVERFADGSGLCNNSVLNILEDNSGNLWLSTFEGLARFSKEKKSFAAFYQGDGLQSNQFLYNAALKLHSGEMVFGGIKGFNLFCPSQVQTRKYIAPIVLSDITINNAALTDSTYVTAMAGDQVKALEIPYNKAVLSMKFAALEYSSPEKIKFAYILEGWDKDWVYTNRNRSISYTNIREGSYRLRIRSTNADGTWNPGELTMAILVLPPWYRTWWAYLLYAATAAAAVYAFMRYKSYQARMKYDMKITSLTAARQREDNERKLSFFTNVVHEFRTPLTLIINPVKDMVTRETLSGTEDEEELHIVYRNARRLLSLVDQLLLFRKTESEAEMLSLGRLQFYDLCNEVYLCFVQQARSKKIDYTFCCENKTLELVADREKIEIALYNLISNALKFTPEGGRVSFTVTAKENGVEIRVEDNGPGVPEGTGDRLFEKFYQVKQDSKTGFGIGLYLAKHFVESHKGSIRYDSTPGLGAIFTMILPGGNAEQCKVTDKGVRSEVLEELAGREVVNVVVTKVRRQKQEDITTERDTILVVDDNEQMRNYIRQIFSDRFSVHTASNGTDALVLAADYLPDIIISDIVMDGGDGIELCRRIKESPELGHIPVLLLTGSPSQDAKLKGVALGAEDYITKPFEKDFLVAKVENLLKSRNSLQKYFYNEITLQKNTHKISPEYKEFIDSCISILEDHLKDDNFTVKHLASALGMSHSKLYKRIKSVSGQTANGFIRFIRLRKAAELFINTKCNVSEAAYYVGMKDIKHFREQFNKTFGMNPSEYIEKFRGTLGKSYGIGRTK